jgi:hypothetical protein
MTDANTNQNDTVVTDAQGEVNQDTNTDNDKPDVTIESLMAEIAQLKADGAKNKTALDKALKEKGEITKALRAKQTAEEQEEEAKREAEEQQKSYIAELENYKRTAEAKARYALQGMNEELATKAAEAEIANDYDALVKIQTQNTERIVKERLEQELKARPQVNAGNGETEEKEDAFLKGFNSVKYKY